MDYLFPETANFFHKVSQQHWYDGRSPQKLENTPFVAFFIDERPARTQASNCGQNLFFVLTPKPYRTDYLSRLKICSIFNGGTLRSKFTNKIAALFLALILVSFSSLLSAQPAAPAPKAKAPAHASASSVKIPIPD